MSKHGWLAVSLLAWVSAGGCSNNNGNADGGADMNNDGGGDGGGGDMGAGAVGDPCKSTTECKEGPTPTCFKSRLFNNTQYLPTPGGYCTSSCTDDSDCGTGSFCVDFGGDGKWCFKDCMGPTDCRSGYACFFGLGCFPDDNLNCNPQDGDGTCTTFDDKEGGCIRAAVGTGTYGTCRELCNLGVDTCADSQGEKRHCIVRDEKHRLDGSTPDPTLSGSFIGPICSFIPEGTLKGAGQECIWDDGQGGMTHYTNVCVQGYECELKGSNPQGQGFSASGDDTCRQLCYLSGGGPAASIDLPDGGTTAASCAVGSCTDIWGVASATKTHLRVGLCR